MIVHTRSYTRGQAPWFASAGWQENERRRGIVAFIGCRVIPYDDIRLEALSRCYWMGEDEKVLVTMYAADRIVTTALAESSSG
jgi:hypothetical protein